MGHHIVEKTDLPDELIKDVAGTLGFQDTQPRVSNCVSTCDTVMRLRSLKDITNM